MLFGIIDKFMQKRIYISENKRNRRLINNQLHTTLFQLIINKQSGNKLANNQVGVHEMIIEREHLAAAISWMSEMCLPEKWGISDIEASTLLGLEKQVSFSELRTQAANNETLSLSNETIQRLSLLLGIWKHLQILAPAGRRDLAIGMFNQPNSGTLLKGQSIKTYLLETNNIDAFYEIKRYLQSYSQSE